MLPATLDAVSSIVDMVEPGMIQVWGSVDSDSVDPPHWMLSAFVSLR